MTASTSSDSSSASSLATTSTSVPASTQQTATSVAPEPPSAPTSESTVSSSKPQPALHPFFRPGGSTSTLPSSEVTDSQAKRPSRSSRTKAPVSYKEDLNAVLRADAAQESARLKEEKREASAARKAQRSTKGRSSDAANGKQKQSGENSDEFEIVESRSSKKAKEPETASIAGENVASSSKTQEKKVVESKPLSLAVKGTGTATSSAHPFFSKKPKQAPPPTLSDEETRVDAVEPEKEGGEKGKGKARIKSSAFDATPASWSLFSAPRISSSKPKKPVNAPWPAAEDTHVIGLGEFETNLLAAARSDLDGFRSRFAASNTQPTSKLSSSQKRPAPPAAENFISQLNNLRPQPLEHSITLNNVVGRFDSIDDFLASSVDISLPSSLTTPFLASSTATRNQMWTDIFRPHSATSCLGNEPNASYLLEWLRRLLVAAPKSVQTKDRKRKKGKGVQRRVDKKARRRRGYSDDGSDLDDFIVDDDEEEEDAIGEWDPEYDEEVFGKFGRIERTTVLTEDEGSLPASQGSVTAPPPPPLTNAMDAGIAAAKQNRFASLETLSNCIILTGPSGSTKTASVYACASQLGYEVFELYPGMGKRSGKELLAAVGDLGRNHMVSSGGVGGGATFKPTPTTSEGGEGKGVRQSLILIEEADLLFEEDKGFWPAIVELVAESKRPVVVTANDLDLIPIHDLPVQEVLEFKPARVGESVGWMQVMAARMGRYLDSESITQMLLHLPGTETPLTNDESEEKGLGVDIRQAITQLQFGHFSSPFPSSPAAFEVEDAVHLLAKSQTEVGIAAIAKATESASLSDIFETTLSPSPIEFSGDPGLDQTSRQWGNYTQLQPQPLARILQQTQQRMFASELEYRATFTDLHLKQCGISSPHPSHTTATASAGGMDEGKLGKAEELERTQLQQLLKPIFKHLPHSAKLSTHHVVDYAPYVRLMALVDDDLAQIHASLHQNALTSDPTLAAGAGVGGGGGRTTRNSSRLTSWLTGGGVETGYERWLWMVGPDELCAARSTSLIFT